MPKRRPWIDRERILSALPRDGVGMTMREIEQATGIGFMKLNAQILVLIRKGRVIQRPDVYPAPGLYWRK